MALPVHEHGLYPFVKMAGVIAWHGEHQVDYTDIPGHGHYVLLAVVIL
jgi:hypothetical protein